MPGWPWEKRSGGGGRRAPHLPLVGKQFGKAGLGMAADAREEVAQVGEGVDPQTLLSKIIESSGSSHCNERL